MSGPMDMTALDAVAAAGTDDVDIAEVALVLAALARPDLDLTRPREHLREITALTARALARESAKGSDPRIVAVALHAALHMGLGYDGDRERYDDLANADLAQVIERRRGLPVALGILYIHAARALGASAHGINFPGHFLIGIATEIGSALIDPFHGGRVLDGDDLEGLLPRGMALSAEHLSVLSDRGTLIRLQTNIASRTRAAKDWPRNALTLETLAHLAPGAGAYRFELGEAYAAMDQSIAARASLAEALKLEPEAEWAGAARALMGRLTRSLN